MSRFNASTVEAHQAGDCDAATCPLCALEETICDRCHGDGEHAQPCGEWHCDECIGACTRCQDEMGEEGFVQ